MWTIRSKDPGRADARRFELVRGTTTASFAEVTDAWRTDAAFSAWFNDTLADVPFAAFRWETPGVTLETMSQPFELVLLDSPGLARSPEPDVFAEHFRADQNGTVLAFENLGGDAVMVVPRPIGPDDAYGHLAAFVRGAPAQQRADLWRKIGDAMLRRVSAKPVWLSTAGAGVSWLHVRLDDRPKYYGFAPYRTLAAG